MQNASGVGTSAKRDDSHHSIVSDIASLIERVQASMKLIESAIVRDAPLGNQEIAADVVVLDDVTPGYVRAHAALNASNASLGVALHVLLDATTSKPTTDEPLGGARRPVRSVHCLR
jgi:hypothetical protein